METRRSRQIGQLMFVALFVMLNTPLLDSSYTGLDMYGFRVMMGIPLSQAIFYSLLINLLIATFSTFLFFLLWRWQYAGRDILKTNVTSSTLAVILPPLVLAFLLVVLFSSRSLDSYFTVVFFPLIIAFLAFAGYSHPRNQINKDMANILFVCCLVCMILGFVLALGGMYLNLAGIPSYPHLDQQTFTWNNLFWSKQVSWQTIGFSGPDAFRDMDRAGFIWMVLTGIIFMELGVGYPTMGMIYRKHLLRTTQA